MGFNIGTVRVGGTRAPLFSSKRSAGVEVVLVFRWWWWWGGLGERVTAALTLVWLTAAHHSQVLV